MLNINYLISRIVIPFGDHYNSTDQCAPRAMKNDGEVLEKMD